jgi:hypothetical protein
MKTAALDQAPGTKDDTVDKILRVALANHDPRLLLEDAGTRQNSNSIQLGVGDFLNSVGKPIRQELRNAIAVEIQDSIQHSPSSTITLTRYPPKIATL